MVQISFNNNNNDVQLVISYFSSFDFKFCYSLYVTEHFNEINSLLWFVFLFIS